MYARRARELAQEHTKRTREQGQQQGYARGISSDLKGAPLCDNLAFEGVWDPAVLPGNEDLMEVFDSLRERSLQPLPKRAHTRKNKAAGQGGGSNEGGGNEGGVGEGAAESQQEEQEAEQEADAEESDSGDNPFDVSGYPDMPGTTPEAATPEPPESPEEGPLGFVEHFEEVTFSGDEKAEPKCSASSVPSSSASSFLSGVLPSSFPPLLSSLVLPPPPPPPSPRPSPPPPSAPSPLPSSPLLPSPEEGTSQARRKRSVHEVHVLGVPNQTRARKKRVRAAPPEPGAQQAQEEQPRRSARLAERVPPSLD